MHLPDALVSAPVGLVSLALAGGLVAVGARRVAGDPRRAAAAGVLGAFVFAAQMINFAVPGAGFSGHLGGGVLLAALLGPWTGLLVMAAVLLVQAVLFADGGLLAWGCNVLNLGAIPALFAWGVVGRALTARGWPRAGAFAAAFLGLMLGASAVVAQVALSGVSGAATGPFAALVLGVHVPIGVAEGLATVARVTFLARVAPEALPSAAPSRGRLAWPAALAVATGGLLAWFASSRPDGLEWSAERAALPEAGGGLHELLGGAQSFAAVLPDYALPGAAGAEAWPAVDGGTSLAGLVGSAVVLAVVGGLGLALRHLARGRPGPGAAG